MPFLITSSNHTITPHQPPNTMRTPSMTGLFDYFIRTGTLPWWAEKMGRQELEAGKAASPKRTNAAENETMPRKPIMICSRWLRPKEAATRPEARGARGDLLRCQNRRPPLPD